jgi:hypothetical protein
MNYVCRHLSGQLQKMDIAAYLAMIHKTHPSHVSGLIRVKSRLGAVNGRSGLGSPDYRSALLLAHGILRMQKK